MKINLISMTRRIQRILETIISVFLVVEFLIILYRIIRRKLISGLPSIAEEIALFFIVWVIFLGAAYLMSLGIRENSLGHLRVNLVEMLLLKTKEKVIRFQFFIMLIILLFVVIFIFSSSFMLKLSLNRVTMRLYLPFFYWRLAPLVSSILMLYFTIVEIIKIIIEIGSEKHTNLKYKAFL